MINDSVYLSGGLEWSPGGGKMRTNFSPYKLYLILKMLSRRPKSLQRQSCRVSERDVKVLSSLSRVKTFAL